MDEVYSDVTEFTAQIVSAYVSNNTIVAENLPGFITSVHESLVAAENGVMEPKKVELIPAVPIKKSVTPEYIICLEDGKKFRSLKRHLRTHYNLSPDEYRQKWGLPTDYPMVSPMYAASRSELAKNMGLGQRKKAA